ncbi:MAG: dTDP-4-dehydrorhamnose 3,5-epimerase [Gaiellaceae bacterium]
MRFSEAPLAGVFVIEIDRIEDERGSFARTYCADEFAARGLEACVVQCSVSFTRRRGTVRGLHWQAEPHAEAKVVRVTRGAVHDVVVDVRAGSPTLHQSFAVRLDAISARSLYIPKGFAHGFQTLEDDTEVGYQVSAAYAPGAACGLRYDDPALAIDWPAPVTVVSERDREHPLLGA